MTRSIRFSAVFAVLAAFVIAAPSAQATTVILDLTCTGCSGEINGAIYTQISPQPTGTGVFPSFVQVKPTGNTDESSGYNTTVNNTFDNGPADTHNHSITLSDLSTVTVGGVEYYEFILDVNEASMNGVNDNYVSLDEVQIFVGGTENASFDTFTDGILDHDGTLVYQMDDGADDSSWVALDFDRGSGDGDMVLLVRADLFGNDPNAVVTLYSEFGQQGVLANDPSGVPDGDYGQIDGFEEWAAGEGGTTPPVPEPSAALVFGIGAVLMGSRVRRQR